MTLDILQKEMIQALKNGDKFRKSVLADMVGNIKTAAINKNCRDNIPEMLVDEVLIKCKKTVQEMIDTCPVERTETLVEYKKQLEIINEFAPNFITDEMDIYNMIQNALITNQIEPTKKNRGAVMKIVVPMFKMKADMKVVSKIVEDMLV